MRPLHRRAKSVRWLDQDDHQRAIADRDWWQANLPPGWRLFGWTYRYAASVYAPCGKHIVEVDGELLANFVKMIKEKKA